MADPEEDPRVKGMRAVQRRSRRRITEREQALTESDVLRAERDRYRDLLRLLVADVEEAGEPQRHSRLLARAREALNG